MQASMRRALTRHHAKTSIDDDLQREPAASAEL